MKQVFHMTLVLAMAAVGLMTALIITTAASAQQPPQNDIEILKNQVKDLIGKSLIHDEQIRQLIANDEKDG